MTAIDEFERVELNGEVVDRIGVEALATVARNFVAGRLEALRA